MILPVAVRELRLAAHAPATYRGRMAIAGLGILGTAWALYDLLEFSNQPTYWVGQTLFFVEAWVVFFLAGIGGFSATADSISQEKRDGTLGLLFLTHLTGRDVVLGKLTARTLPLFSALAALCPILALPVLMGGIQFAQCAHLLLSVLNTTFFAAAAGLLVSTQSTSQEKARSSSLQLILFFVGGLPLLAMLCRHFTLNPTISLALDLLSPLYAQRLAFGALTGGQHVYFWVSSGMVFALGFLFLSLACWRAPRCWQIRATAPTRGLWRMKFAGWLHATIRTRSVMGQRLLDENPYQWLAVRRQSVRRSSWIFILLTVICGAGLTFLLTRAYDFSNACIGLGIPLAYLLQAGLKFRINSSAISQVAEAKESGALELILSTPLKINQIVVGQFRAALELFGVQLIFLILLLATGLLFSLHGLDNLAALFTSPAETAMFRFRAAAVVMSLSFFLALDSITFTWTGLWFALRSRNRAQAHGWCLFLVLMFPFLAHGLVVSVLFQSRRIHQMLLGFYPLGLLYCGIALGIDLFLIFFCRHRLFHAARRGTITPIAAERFQGPFPTRPVTVIPN